MVALSGTVRVAGAIAEKTAIVSPGPTATKPARPPTETPAPAADVIVTTLAGSAGNPGINDQPPAAQPDSISPRAWLWTRAATSMWRIVDWTRRKLQVTMPSAKSRLTAWSRLWRAALNGDPATASAAPQCLGPRCGLWTAAAMFMLRKKTVPRSGRSRQPVWLRLWRVRPMKTDTVTEPRHRTV